MSQTPFADPFRLRVVKALSACLEEITPANGYGHDLTGAVFRGRDLFGGEDDPVPMVSILEPPLPIDPIVPPPLAKDSYGDWDLLLQGFCRDDIANPCDPAYRLLADVKRRLVIEKKRARSPSGLPGRGTPDPLGLGINPNGVSNVVSQLIIGPGVVRPPGDGISDKAYFWLTLTVKIAEDIEQPFL
ncbi:MAG: hypothetical protein DI537_19170 [Stutzerimonas stutzeri]|nr:MAG: hypothetical protein DI537_19170 [Stutzerimonas stutzeri]